MKVHELKCWSEYFRALSRPEPRKRKTLEVRRNDRDYKVGDYLVLREYDPKTEKYLDNIQVFLVSHIVAEPFMTEGLIAMSLYAPSCAEVKDILDFRERAGRV